jgi:glycosyltransferase involved in cell wall biosynthesis
MRFSVIIPSFLGNYAGAASRREEKIIRAVNSVLDQTFTDFEVLVIADGCQFTVDLMRQITDERVTTTLIKKAPMWDGIPRNTGIDLAKGEFIVYLDIDDYWGENHLQIINDNLKDYDWVFYNDIIFSGGEWVERVCDVRRLGQNGTSNVCHKKSLGARWGHRGYAHDHYFNQSLMMKSRKYTKIATPEYFVMHLPGSYDN